MISIRLRLAVLFLAALPLSLSASEPDFLAEEAVFPVVGDLSGVVLQFQAGARGLSFPTSATHAGDDRLFVTLRDGRIKIVVNGGTIAKPFLDIRSLVGTGGEGGLLSVAFHPRYAQNGFFFVNYTDKNIDTIIARYRVKPGSPNEADPASARVLLKIDQPFSNHNGGLLKFGPDGYLYIGMGDGGAANDPQCRAQRDDSLLGKMLRIDPRRSGGRPYSVPSSNPFVNRSGARGEIYSYGLRNPWRFSFDRETGDLSIGDVGQNEIEEIDFVREGEGRGANFGWRPFEGRSRIFPDEDAPGHVPPVIQTRHSDGYCSITGGYVVRDPAVPALRGQYVYSDFCDGRIRAARLSPGRAANDRRAALPRVRSVSSFGEDAQGRVYVLSLDGPVYRITQR